MVVVLGLALSMEVASATASTFSGAPASFAPTLAASDEALGGQDGGEVLAFQAATDALNAWTWSPARDASVLAELLDDVALAASLSAPASAWSQAAPYSALSEASLRVAGRARLPFANTMRELAHFAPSESDRVRAVRLEVRFLEAVCVGSSSPKGVLSTAFGSPEQEQAAAWARARIQEILDGGEHLEDGAAMPASRYQERLEGRLNHLAVGSRSPRFLARDTAGNEIRSTLMPGKVAVIRFWEQASPVSMAAHEEDALLERKFWDAPVALFGATHSGDRETHMGLLAERSFAGTQLFDGPISVALADELALAGDHLVHGAGLSSAIGITEAWFKPAPGSLVVVDEAGIIRGRDLHGDELESLVSVLVAERRARLRASGEGDVTGSSSR